MPSEIRHLMFRPAEVATAVQSYHRRMGKALPPGDIVACAAEGNGTERPVCVRMTIIPDKGTEPRHLLIDSTTLAAALILHCRDARIPMASRAEKSLQRFGEQVCLVATINARAEVPG